MLWIISRVPDNNENYNKVQYMCRIGTLKEELPLSQERFIHKL